MYKILIADDEEMIRRLIAKYAVFEEVIVITFIVMCLAGISASMLLDIFFVIKKHSLEC